MVMLIVNYDGVWEDVHFNPKSIFLLAVTPKDTLKTLSDKICDRFGLNCDAGDMKFSTLLSGTVVEMKELHPMGHEAEQDYWADIDVDLSKGPQSAWRGGQPSPPIETDTPTESPPLDFQEQFPFDVACCA
ncbi:hypothetical protein LWI29_000548 [Acer saccharum]|uniref:Uncharacterized protein n=1 Tax=Acer saccharum TaxID=4024 RepID=A0AA39VNL2_ACESA|nr:hypothetical protein LWI29_000548 [Acer saccharum]